MAIIQRPKCLFLYSLTSPKNSSRGLADLETLNDFVSNEQFPMEFKSNGLGSLRLQRIAG